MIRQCLIHVVALLAGFAIIVGMTLLATYLRAGDDEQRGVHCYDCQEASCINNVSAILEDCAGVCLKTQIFNEKQELMWVQLCKIVPDPSTSACPQEFIDYLKSEGAEVKQCSICRNNLCNFVTNASATAPHTPNTT